MFAVLTGVRSDCESFLGEVLGYRGLGLHKMMIARVENDATALQKWASQDVGRLLMLVDNEKEADSMDVGEVACDASGGVESARLPHSLPRAPSYTRWITRSEDPCIQNTTLSACRQIMSSMCIHRTACWEC